MLYVLKDYAQVSQTYIESEIRALAEDYDLRVVALHRPDVATVDAFPHEHVGAERNGTERLDEIVREFRPHVLHAHYLSSCELLLALARRHDLPFTIRAHSFDVMIAPPKPKNLRAEQRRMRRNARLANDERCLGVLSFPFTRPLLEAAGLRGEKIVDCYPVIDFDRFYHRSAPESVDVMNVGAGSAKKRMEDFVDLGARMPDRRFDLYPVGYTSDVLHAYNERHGSPVHIHEVVQPADMPAVYRAHGWLVYTACPERKNVGWPLSVGEARAAGLGVCMHRIRPDLEEYLAGAGFLYDSIDELPRILSQPYPEEMRERGWEEARKSDIRRHLHLLTDRWQPHLSRSAGASAPSRSRSWAARSRRRSAQES